MKNARMNFPSLRCSSEMILIAIFLLSFAVYRYFLRRSLRGGYPMLPGADRPFFGNAPEMFSYVKDEAFHEWIEKADSFNERIIGFDVPFFDFRGVIVSDASISSEVFNRSPDWGRDDLFQKTFNGIATNCLFFIPHPSSTWKRHRKKLQVRFFRSLDLQPAFNPQTQRYAAVFTNQVCDLMFDSWDSQIRNGLGETIIDLYRYSSSLAMDVIGRVSFSFDFECCKSLSDSGTSTLTSTFSSFREVGKRTQLRSFAHRWLWWLFGSSAAQIKPYSDDIMNVINVIINEKYEKANEKSDSEITSPKDLLDILIHENSKDTFSLEELRDEVFAFLFAGHEVPLSYSFLDFSLL